MRLLSLSILIVIIFSCTPQISKKSTKTLHQANKSIHLLLRSEAYATFNGSILVAKKGNIIIQQNYGYTDFNKTSLITNESKFNIGSAAKEIPAVALLELINEGKLDYNDPINKYLTYLPSWSKNITIKDLLFYKSGLPQMDLLVANSDEHAINEIIKIESLLFEPGSNYLYSNWNNFLQAKMVEAVLNVDFQFYIKEKYFDPLKMNGAIYNSNPPRTTKNITKSYDRVNGDDAQHNPNYKNFELCFGPLYMTPADLLKWVDYVQFKYRKKRKRY